MSAMERMIVIQVLLATTHLGRMTVSAIQSSVEMATTVQVNRRNIEWLSFIVNECLILAFNRNVV